MANPIVNISSGSSKLKFNILRLKIKDNTCTCEMKGGSELSFEFLDCSFTGKIWFEVDKFNFIKIKVTTLFK